MQGRKGFQDGEDGLEWRVQERGQKQAHFCVLCPQFYIHETLHPGWWSTEKTTGMGLPLLPKFFLIKQALENFGAISLKYPEEFADVSTQRPISQDPMGNVVDKSWKLSLHFNRTPSLRMEPYWSECFFAVNKSNIFGSETRKYAPDHSEEKEGRKS